MKNINKILTSLIIGGTILSTSIVAFATETTTNSGDTTSKSRTQVSGKMRRGDKSGSNLGKTSVKHNIENDLKALVSAGVISQDEADKLLALSNTNEGATTDKTKADKRGGNKDNIFTQAVSGGILTQEKADAAKEKLQEIHGTEKKAKLTEGLSSLVTATTITQEQADKVIAYMDTVRASKKASDTAPATNETDKKTNPLSALVDNGTLTQAQLDEVSKVLPMGGGHGHGGHDGAGKAKGAKTTTDTETSTASN
jgi:hypothetical protein